MKKIRYFICAVLIIITFSFCSSAYAYDLYSFDIENKCSINMSLITNGWKNDAVKGAEVTIYRVADIEVKNNRLTYKYCNSFSNCGYDLDEPDNPKLAWSIYTFAIENRIKGTSLITDNEGKVVFKELDPGLYLGAETMSVKNYCDFSPFLLSLPMAENDRWIYNVSATPKIEIERFIDITVNKFWNDNGINRPDNIQVQLISDDGVYDTVKLSSENNWSYTWELIPYRADWDVKELNVPDGYSAEYERDGFDFNIYNTGGYDEHSTVTSTTVSRITSTCAKTATTTTADTVVKTSIISTDKSESNTLVQTGQLKWPIPVLVCIGITLIAAGISVTGCGGKNENKR